MATCDVCLNLNWDLYPDSDDTHPPVAELEVESQQLRRGVERNCPYCFLVQNGIETIRALPPYSFQDSWDPSNPYTVFISPRKDLPLEALVRFNHGDGVRLYRCHFRLEYYSLKGISPFTAR
jgi:hypothetical protein